MSMEASEPVSGREGEAARAAPLLRRAASPMGIAAILFVGLGLLPLIASVLGDSYLPIIAARIMILAIAALSLELILGYGGMISFGHAAFIGIGAYTVGIMAKSGVTDYALQALATIVVSSLFALPAGAISLRTRGVYFIMITLAFGQMAYFFMVSLSAYGGDDGLTLVSRSTLAGWRLFGSNPVFYYFVLALLAGFFLLLRTIIASRFGRVLRGIRDNPERMRAIGFSPFPYQLAAYCIAGAMAGLAGTLLANQVEFVSPAYMSWQRSGDLTFMVVLGGMGTLAGPLLGAAGLIALEELLSGFSEHWKLGLGVILVLVVIYTQGGLIGLLRRFSAEARDG
jgi:branched-chain amino acid transport system permease protein